MRTNKVLLVLILLNIAKNVFGAKILGVFPIPSKSHNILASSLMRGHEIVFVTPMSSKVPKELNYTEVLLPEVWENWKGNTKNFLNKIHTSFIEQSLWLRFLLENCTRSTMEQSSFQNLLKDHRHFDAVIVHQYHMDAFKVLSWYYKAPLVVFHSFGPNGWINYYTANPFPTSYAPEVYSQYDTDMDFWQRMKNTFISFTMMLYNQFLMLPTQKKIYEEFFPDAPPFEDVIYNTSIVLLMSDISTYPPIPKVPSMIDIGGFHVRPAKTLPPDIKKIMDEAEHGVIFFSMGSNLKSVDMNPKIIKSLLRVFSKVKQTVLWKWENENIPDKPDNVVIRTWMPQQEILGHPNLHLFVSHGGLLSTTEAIYHGVPMMAIPVFVDQYINAQVIINKGFGLKLPYEEFTEEKFENNLKELLNNSSYRSRAKEVNKIFHDKPMKPMDTAAYWVEYVIRHKGATHLRVAGLKLTWYQYWLLDIVAFFVVTLIIVLYLVKKLFTTKKIIEKKEKKIKKK